MSVTIDDIKRARERLDDESIVRKTPIETSRSLDERSGASVRLKMEHLQRTGSFKTRGAYNKLQQVAEDADSDPHVVAASAGNHAQGVALAATKADLDATIVMPKTAPQAKIDATRGYGATVDLLGYDFRAAMEYALSLADENENTVFVHAYDDPDIVAGQGTLGLEIHEQVPDLDTVVVPIGGGGLIGGIATAISELDPDVRVVGVQAANAATVPESLHKGGPVQRDSVQTIADGIATGGISDLTYGLIDRHVDEIVTVSDTEIAYSILFLLERTKQMVEGAGAASVAAVLGDELDVEGETVAPILCGGNLSMTMLQRVLNHALSYRSQLLQMRVRIRDEPGKVSEISGIMADEGVNIKRIRHERAVESLDVGEAYLYFRIETSGKAQTERIIEAIETKGYEVEIRN